MKPAFELATILNRHWDQANEQLKLNGWQWRTLHAIRSCRTADLGGHIDQCDQCGHLHISYNSCRNRHCPKCQGQQRKSHDLHPAHMGANSITASLSDYRLPGGPISIVSYLAVV